jgi:DNA invertase Pin-like site-specific DNA recombinase
MGSRSKAVTTETKIGYARVSTPGQKLDSQLDALTAAGCTKIFSDKQSGVSRHRPDWDRLMEYIRVGDTLVIQELSRMSRSLLNLLEITRQLEEKGIGLISLREHIDTATATGRRFLSIMGAIAQMERELKAERAAAGRASAKARGRTGGRPRTPHNRLEQARILYENSEQSAAQVSTAMGIGRRTLFAYLATRKAAQEALAEGR